MIRVIRYFCIAAAFSIVIASSAFADCPPNSSVRSESSGVVHCKCNAGYENRGGECKPVPVMRPKPEPSMRAITRPECVRFAGYQLQKDLEACKTPLVDCMVNAGVRINEATCTATTLVSALVIAADPTKVTAAVVLPTVAGSVVVCAREVYDAADKCSPAWGTCQVGPLDAHKAAMAACPAK